MEQSLSVDGISVGYDVDGEGDPLLLIHDLSMGRKVWGTFLTAAARLFKVYAVDLPGFGGSEKPDAPYGVPYYVEFVRKFLDAAGVKKTALAACGLGGAVAASFAARYPDRVTRLILVAPAGLTPLRGPRLRNESLALANLWLTAQNRGMVTKMYEDAFEDPQKAPAALIDEMWAQLRDPAYRRAYYRNFLYMAQPHPDFAVELGQIKAPTLILWGSGDRVAPASDAEKFGELVPHADVRVLERGSHMLLQERREACADAMLSFLGEIDLYYPNE